MENIIYIISIFKNHRNIFNVFHCKSKWLTSLAHDLFFCWIQDNLIRFKNIKLISKRTAFTALLFLAQSVHPSETEIKKILFAKP